MTCCVDAAMECLANITEAVGEAVSPHITKLLEPLFMNGLSKQVNGIRVILTLRCMVSSWFILFYLRVRVRVLAL